MYLLRQLYLPVFMQQSSKRSMKSYVSAFAHILTLPQKSSRSTQGHHLNNLSSTQVLKATKFSVHRVIGSCEEDF